MGFLNDNDSLAYFAILEENNTKCQERFFLRSALNLIDNGDSLETLDMVHVKYVLP